VFFASLLFYLFDNFTVILKRRKKYPLLCRTFLHILNFDFHLDSTAFCLLTMNWFRHIYTFGLSPLTPDIYIILHIIYIVIIFIIALPYFNLVPILTYPLFVSFNFNFFSVSFFLLFNLCHIYFDIYIYFIIYSVEDD